MRHAASFGPTSAAERRQAGLFWADLFGDGRQAADDEAENWIPEPSFPKRTSNVTGEVFVNAIAGDKRPSDWQRREDAMVAQLLAGNIPSWLQISRASAIRTTKVWRCCGCGGWWPSMWN